MGLTGDGETLWEDGRITRCEVVWGMWQERKWQRVGKDKMYDGWIYQPE